MANDFGFLLRNLRRSHVLSQAALARRAHMSQSYISGLEAGKRHPPTQEYVEILAEALRLDDESRRRLFESAGFVPLTPNENNGSTEYWDIDRIVNRLLLFSDERDIVVRDLLDRIDNWALYQQASVAALSDKNFSRYVCELIASKERRSALMTRVSGLYVKSKK